MKAVGSPFVKFPRDDLIKNAIEFLQEPNVARASEDKKRNFLKTKGMTDEEIDTAFRLANPNEAPWKSIVFVVFVCIGIGKAIFVLVKKYLIPLFWKKKNTETKEKILTIQEEIKSQINTISNLFSSQTKEILTTLGIIESFKIKILEEEKDFPNTDSEIQKEIRNLKLTLNAARASQFKRNDSPFSTHYSDLLAEVVSIKRAILDATGNKGSSSVKTNQDALIQSQKTTVPWKLEKQNSKPVPTWLSTKPKLDWLYQKTEKETKQTPPTEGTGEDNPNPPIEGVSTVDETPMVGSDFRPFNRRFENNGGPTTVKSNNSGDMEKMNRKESLNLGGDSDLYGYSEAFKKFTQAVAKLPPNMKPEDFPGVKKIDDSPLEQF